MTYPRAQFVYRPVVSGGPTMSDMRAEINELARRIKLLIDQMYLADTVDKAIEDVEDNLVVNHSELEDIVRDAASVSDHDIRYDNRYLKLTGGTMLGHINMNGHSLLNVQDIVMKNTGTIGLDLDAYIGFYNTSADRIVMDLGLWSRYVTITNGSLKLGSRAAFAPVGTALDISHYFTESPGAVANIYAYPSITVGSAIGLNNQLSSGSSGQAPFDGISYIALKSSSLLNDNINIPAGMGSPSISLYGAYIKVSDSATYSGIQPLPCLYRGLYAESYLSNNMSGYGGIVDYQAMGIFSKCTIQHTFNSSKSAGGSYYGIYSDLYASSSMTLSQSSGTMNVYGTYGLANWACNASPSGNITANICAIYGASSISGSTFSGMLYLYPTGIYAKSELASSLSNKWQLRYMYGIRALTQISPNFSSDNMSPGYTNIYGIHNEVKISGSPTNQTTIGSVTGLFSSVTYSGSDYHLAFGSIMGAQFHLDTGDITSASYLYGIYLPITDKRYSVGTACGIHMAPNLPYSESNKNARFRAISISESGLHWVSCQTTADCFTPQHKFYDGNLPFCGPVYYGLHGYNLPVLFKHHAPNIGPYIPGIPGYGYFPLEGVASTEAYLCGRGAIVSGDYPAGWEYRDGITWNYWSDFTSHTGGGHVAGISIRIPWGRFVPPIHSPSYAMYEGLERPGDVRSYGPHARPSLFVAHAVNEMIPWPRGGKMGTREQLNMNRTYTPDNDMIICIRLLDRIYRFWSDDRIDLED